VITEDYVDRGDAFFAFVEVFNFLQGHAYVDFCFTGVGLFLRESRQFVAKVFKLLCIELTLTFHVLSPELTRIHLQGRDFLAASIIFCS
jgi:hypothetical protein